MTASLTMTDEESQKDEICVLESIYNDEEFNSCLENEKICGRFDAFVELPACFDVVYKNLNVGDEGEPNKIQIGHLPPVSLFFELPQNYPSISPPDFQLSCAWLSSVKIGKLALQLDKLWEQNKGTVVLFTWTHFLKEESLEFLGVSNCLDISRKYTSELKKLKKSKDTAKLRVMKSIMECQNNEGAVESSDTKHESEKKEANINGTTNEKKEFILHSNEDSSGKHCGDSVETSVGAQSIETNSSGVIFNESQMSTVIENNLAKTVEEVDSVLIRKKTSTIYEEMGSLIVVNSTLQKSPLRKFGRNASSKTMEKQNSETQSNVNMGEGKYSSTSVDNNPCVRNINRWKNNKPLNPKKPKGYSDFRRTNDKSRSESKWRKNRNGFRCVDSVTDNSQQPCVPSGTDLLCKQGAFRNNYRDARDYDKWKDKIRKSPSFSVHLHDYLIKYDEDRKRSVFGRNIFRCNICFEDRLGVKCIQFMPCDHIYCRECIAGYFEVKINEGSVISMPCPQEKCSSEATQHQIRELVGPNLFARYDNLLLSATLNAMEDITYCPRTVCQCPVMRDSDEKLATCPSCQYVFCVYCKMTYHGVEPCRLKSEEKRILIAQYQNGDAATKQMLESRYGKRQILNIIHTAQSENWISENSKQCPQCSAAIEKSDGCNRMVCWKCNTFFCWLCSRVLDPTDPYKHFYDPSSRCRDLLFHGTYEEDDDDDDDDDLFDEEFFEIDD